MKTPRKYTITSQKYTKLLRKYINQSRKHTNRPRKYTMNPRKYTTPITITFSSFYLVVSKLHVFPMLNTPRRYYEISQNPLPHTSQPIQTSAHRAALFEAFCSFLCFLREEFPRVVNEKKTASAALRAPALRE